MEKMLVTQALDERDILLDKINDKIHNLKAFDFKRHNATTTEVEKIDAQTFSEKAISSFQQINDLVKRYRSIVAAIVESNANTYVETSIGKFSVAQAIALKNELGYETTKNFDFVIRSVLERAFCSVNTEVEKHNAAIEASAEKMRLSILGKDQKNKDSVGLEIVDTYVKENSYEFVDPLDIKELIQTLKDYPRTLAKELEVQIKISNATTFIEF